MGCALSSAKVDNESIYATFLHPSTICFDFDKTTADARQNIGAEIVTPLKCTWQKNKSPGYQTGLLHFN